MAAKKVGELIKEARTEAGLSQAALAKKVDDVTAAQIGKAERGEINLTQAQLKQIAKATGVTQSSLLNAPKSSSAKTASTSSAKKTSSAKSTSAKKTSSAKTSSAKTSSKTSSKKTSSSGDLKLTATEKKLVELYRKAESANKKLAMKILSGEKFGVEDVLPITSVLGDTFGGTLGNLLKK
ncbi:MAG: helix-turn-helix transcriptional regulator [Lachnospiraceae bacterium]|nr:helix-turn-helix transcriptional regulator [Lachnospiraceae bacterium]